MPNFLRSGCASLALLACCVAGEQGAASSLRIELRAATESVPAGFDVVGLDARALQAFEKLSAAQQAAAFRVVVDGLDDPPPVGGNFSVEKRTLRFTPRYPLERGVKYRVDFDRGKLSAGERDAHPVIAAEFSLSKPDMRATTVVDTIYPTSEVLPENQLKFYLHFSAPMSRGEAYRHIHLFDASGKEVEAPFLELGEELWDGDFRRFTLLCDPGRVKRGLKPREELGPVLREGERFTLVVDKNWRDATRTPLAAGMRKNFSVAPPDDAPIDPARWKVASPAAGGVEPLVVRFGEPLDHALAERVVWVADPAGKQLSGSIRTSDHEATWHFTPKRPWRAGAYQLMAETTLEDLAGNAIGRAFEVDELKPIVKRVETQTISRPFSVAP